MFHRQLYFVTLRDNTQTHEKYSPAINVNEYSNIQNGIIGYREKVLQEKAQLGICIGGILTQYNQRESKDILTKRFYVEDLIARRGLEIIPDRFMSLSNENFIRFILIRVATPEIKLNECQYIIQNQLLGYQFIDSIWEETQKKSLGIIDTQETAKTLLYFMSVLNDNAKIERHLRPQDQKNFWLRVIRDFLSHLTGDKNQLFFVQQKRNEIKETLEHLISKMEN